MKRVRMETLRNFYSRLTKWIDFKWRKEKAENPKGLSVFDPESMTLEDKRKWIENIIAMGEDIRKVLRDQIKYLEVGIGVRHFKISERKNQVRDWFEAVADDLEWIFDTKMMAAKFRNSYSLPVDDLSTPRLTIISTKSYEEQLEDLDRIIERGIWKLEKMIPKLAGNFSKRNVSITGGDYVEGDKIGRDKNVAKKIGVDNSSGNGNNLPWWLLRVVGTVIAGLLLAWLSGILKL